MRLDVINLEYGLPKVSDALDTLAVELTNLKCDKAKCALIIHGYGKRTQGGGKIKEAARTELLNYQNDGVISKVIFGEDLSMFDEKVMRLRYDYPDLSQYVGKRNLGVTLVVF